MKDELGDAILFSYEQDIDPSGNVQGRTARGVVIQAKIAKAPAQLVTPVVPVTTGPSSMKELALLSAWPPFHLYATAGNHVSTLSNVTLAPNSTPPPEGWFIAAPGERPTSAGAWRSWWMAGCPAAGAPCDVTLGELLVAFLSPSVTGLEVGRAFVSDQPAAPARPRSSPPDWSDLCNAVRRIAMTYEAPRSTFARPPWHIGPGLPRIYRVPISMLYAAYPYGLSATQLQWDAAGLKDLGNRSDDPFRSFKRCGPIVPEGGERGIFVLSVTITRLQEERRPG